MFSSNFIPCCTRMILLVLYVLTSSSEGNSAIDKEDLVSYIRHHASSSTQKPRICQIYSRSTKKHIQIYPKKVIASGAHGDVYSKLEKTSITFGVVTIRGIKSNRFLCMSRRGKLVAKKKLASDGSCLFVENITTAYWTSFRSENRANWYVGFNAKSGKPKKARKTSEHQEACNFLVRDPEASEPEEDTFPDYMRDVVLRLQIKLRHTQGLSRRRRHRFQTENPIFDDTNDVIDSLPGWIKEPPLDASPEEKREWLVRVQSVIDNLQPGSPRNLTSPVPDRPHKTHRRNKEGRRKNKSPKGPRSGRGRNKKKLNAALAENEPTSTPSRREGRSSNAAAPRTPLRPRRGEEPKDPPTVASPSFSRSRTKKNLAAFPDLGAVVESENRDREPTGPDDISNSDVSHNQTKVSTNDSKNDDASRTATLAKSSKASSQRSRHTRHRSRRGRSARQRRGS